MIYIILTIVATLNIIIITSINNKKGLALYALLFIFLGWFLL